MRYGHGLWAGSSMCVSICRLLGVIDQLTESYPIQQTPQPLSRDAFQCSLYPALGNEALSFSPEFEENGKLPGSASITLPGSLSSSLSSRPGLSFCGYREESLFIRREKYLGNSAQGSLTLASRVVSARLFQGVVASNLEEPIRMSFKKIQVSSAISYDPSNNHSLVLYCVAWNPDHLLILGSESG